MIKGEELCALTGQLWRNYLMDNTSESRDRLFSRMGVDTVLAGAGDREFHIGPAACDAMERERESLSGAGAVLTEERFDCRTLADDLILVYGGFSFHEAYGKAVSLRLSVIYRFSQGSWAILFAHHSKPCGEEERVKHVSGDMAAFLRQVSERMERYRVRAERDMMTGCLNRSAFQSYVEKELREGKEGFFYMIDLDDFKKVNDTLGHPLGDRIIEGMARALMDNFGKEAIVGRMGGDEFAVFDSHLFCVRAAEEKAEKIIRDYRQLASGFGKGVPASCSVGIAAAKEREDFSLLYESADRALYSSKKEDKGTFRWFFGRPDRKEPEEKG